MISPEEIKIQALKWWKPFLQSHLKCETFFPRTIDRIAKITSSCVREKLSELQTQLDALHNNSKQKLGYGYVVNRANISFRRTGTHSLPQSITFESLNDYISFIEKEKDWDAFLNSIQLIQNSIPQLTEWVFSNPVTVIENNNIWPELLKVCKYFLKNPKPNLYIRQLPIDIHTKFIESNESVIKSLLDFLIPEYKRDESEKAIAKRYFLKYDEPTIRIRILDPKLKIDTLSDLRVPLNDFKTLNIKCSNIVITENKMNFLALPNLPSTIAIWSGGGFMVSYLKGVEWFQNMNVLYWGDMDAHGFLILHQVRSYFSQTESAMMNMETFNQFKGQGLTKGEIISQTDLKNLYEFEKEVFLFVKANNYRLEQEKITQSFSDKVLIDYFAK
ncbi:MAG: hypothetical protein JWQ09_1103 [Segetibacter sp.]|nr:hypothetical protein [Segetibacter sp.]